MESWSTQRSAELYGIHNWGEGYFDVNAKGNVVVRPERNGNEVDLYEFVNSLVQRGIDVPVLVRFDGILRDRVRRINLAFQSAIKESGYGAGYKGVYPIKVNQQRHIVDIIRAAGREFALGLEVGSKPELIAVLAIHDTPDALLLCNGYKDSEYIELALTSAKLGRRPIIIVEQLYELNHVIELSKRLGVDAEIGLRMKPTSKGSGRWEGSAGDKAKFGLTPSEIMTAVEELKRHGKDHWLRLLHFHIGSQITSIAAIKRVLREGTRMYTELAKLCPSMSFFDVGGGLGVDYDGSRTNFESSMNYTVEEYARDVVYAIQEACQSEKLPPPDIVSESGRALVAHHSVLVGQVIDVAPALEAVQEVPPPPTKHPILQQMFEMYGSVSVKNCHETYNDAVSLRDDLLETFNQGDLSLLERAYAEKTFWHLMAKISSLSVSLKYRPEDLERLEETLKDTYFCNFSVFQSVPDSWAINQLFPIMPIQRLHEEPSRRACLADVSCDSDGKVDRFIDLKDVKGYIRLHPMKKGEPYYFAIFLVGAYQEILGDLHNLFGDTNAVHVNFESDGELTLTHVVEGDTMREVLSYVQYDAQDLLERLRVALEKSMSKGRITAEESAKVQRRFREALDDYTYLKVGSSGTP